MHFVTPVWGAEFTRTFCEVTLPSLLSPGNIPAAPNLGASLYRIFTTKADEEFIVSTAAYAQLRAHVQVEFRQLDPNAGNKYKTSSDCYRSATQTAVSADAAALFLIPDMVFADGGIRSIARILESGYRAVLVLGLRTVKETFVPEVKQRFAVNGHICAPARELVGVGARHLHPGMSRHFLDGASEEGLHPSILGWRVGDDGFLVRSFHPHPVAFRPRGQGVNFSSTIDDDLIENSGLSADDVFVISDSDQILWFELSSRAYDLPIQTERTVKGVVRWMSGFTTQFSRTLLQHSIRIHAGELDTAEWRAAEERSREVVERLLSAYATHSEHALASAAGSRRWLLQLQLRAEGYLARHRSPPPGASASIVKLFAACVIVAAFRVAQFIHAPVQKTKEWSGNRL